MENLVSITIWRGFGLNASHTWTSRATPRESKPWPSPYESSRNVSFVPSRISSFQIKFHWPRLRSKIMYLLEKEHSTAFRHITRAYIEPKSIELHSKISSRNARNQLTGKLQISPKHQWRIVREYLNIFNPKNECFQRFEVTIHFVSEVVQIRAWYIRPIFVWFLAKALSFNDFFSKWWDLFSS